MQNLISIIIINYNGLKFLKTCLESVFRTDYDNFEVIFVDNASTDTSLGYLTEHFFDSRLHVVRADKNYGVPGGRNLGFQHSKGKYIVFLDNDTEVERSWLKELVVVFESDPRIAVAQCKLLNMVDRTKYDHAGDYLTPFGFLYERSNQAVDHGRFDKIEDIFNAKGAATMIKGSVFKELGMYDESYFMYLEETDFCFRVWLSGLRVVFAPKAVVWHAFETPLKETKIYYSKYVVRYYGCRNYITTLLKNLDSVNVLKILPFHIFGWFVLALSFLLKGKVSDAWWIVKGILWNIVNIKNVLDKRSLVQKKIRKVSDKELFGQIMVAKEPGFYFKKALCYLQGQPFYES